MCTLHDYNPGHALKRRYGRLYTALDAAAHPKPLYLPGYEYRGEPLLVTEFGGIALAHSAGSDGRRRPTPMSSSRPIARWSRR